jgi:hypothetical protein
VPWVRTRFPQRFLVPFPIGCDASGVGDLPTQQTVITNERRVAESLLAKTTRRLENGSPQKRSGYPGSKTVRGTQPLVRPEGGGQVPLPSRTNRPTGVRPLRQSRACGRLRYTPPNFELEGCHQAPFPGPLALLDTLHGHRLLHHRLGKLSHTIGLQTHGHVSSNHGKPPRLGWLRCVFR